VSLVIASQVDREPGEYGAAVVDDTDAWNSPQQAIWRVSGETACDVEDGLFVCQRATVTFELALGPLDVLNALPPV
jgi:hypothetical protein